MRINGWLIALASVAAPLHVPIEAAACGCSPVIDRPALPPLAQVQEQLAWADQVFVGRVTGRNNETVTLSVEASWKGSGAPAQTLRVATVLPDGTEVISDCDFGFESEVRYVVFAHRTSRGLAASSCSMTRRVDQAGDLIGLLDRATPRQAVSPRAKLEQLPRNLQMQPTRRVSRDGARLNRGR